MITLNWILSSGVSVVSSIEPVPGSPQIIPHDSVYDTNCKWFVVFHDPKASFKNGAKYIVISSQQVKIKRQAYAVTYL